MKTAYLENIVIVICFTILSVVFQKWWIILFGFLILNTNKNYNKFDKTKK